MVSLSDVKDIADTTLDIAKRLADPSVSLSQYMKPTQIIGRAYIEPSIATDDIAVPLMGVLNQMYVAFVMCALGYASLITCSQTGAAMLRSIGNSGEKLDIENDPVLLVGATRAFKDKGNTVLDKFCDAKFLSPKQYQDGIIKDENGNPIELLGSSEDVGIVDLDKVTQRLTVGRVIEFSFKSPIETTIETEEKGSTTTITESTKREALAHDDSVVDLETGAVKTTTTKPKTVSTTKGRTDEFKLYVYVQIIPNIIPTDVCEGFMDVVFAPTLRRRWTQLRAGEIKFWKDFIFCADLARRKKQLMKKDETGLISEIISRGATKTFTMFKDAMDKESSSNLANSFIIIDKESFIKGCANSGVNFSNYSSRQQFFRRTYAIMLVVVDTLGGKVDMYINGFKLPGTYTYDMINKVGTNGKDAFDFKQVMAMLSTGNAPRF